MISGVLMRVYLIVLAALVGLLLMQGAGGVAAAAEVAEVRITAALASAGRIEFALQQREADEAWGERQLPRQRFFPNDSRVDIWLVSTPLSVLAPAGGESVEVRITARRVANGRTEFALQQREADGVAWGERQLPPQRYFPVTATATEGRWLVSTPLSVLLPEIDAAAGVAADRAVLVAFYNATGGANWRDSTNWLSDEPIEDWYGVSTDAAGRVTTLSFRDEGLSGGIPSELGDLSNLEELDLDDNKLTGVLPSELGNLSNLSVLALWGNQLTGTIPPELGNLSNLWSLYLDGNALTGVIPPELGNLSNLWALSLSSNQLTGVIPPELGNLSNLSGLNLGGNQLTGVIPPELGNLSNLWGLGLRDNQLTGTIPPELGNLSNLWSLYLDGNALTGCVPVGLRDLRWHDLDQTDLPDCGSVATDRAALVALYNATDGANWKTGGPGWWPDVNWLTERPLDEWQGVSTDEGGRVIEIDLVSRGLTGAIPSELGNLTNLTVLRLRANPLSGSLPPELGGLTNLEVLDLGLSGFPNRIGFTGAIPPELGGLTNLRVLDIALGSLSGPIPPELGNLSNLSWLNLGGNQLTGVIPPELGNPSNLEGLNLGGNQLTGVIPPELGNLSNLWGLDLESNQLTGTIPPEFGNLSNLVTLYLDGNEWTGCVPVGLRDLRWHDLDQIDLPDCGS